MSIFNALTLFGGLALFLYGMDLMGKGLEKASGGKLERILENLTSNIFKAVFLGIAVTGVIQSSSATTVMVVGFVNSGIMPLSRAIGIIMGANIGTTVTSWILSLAGIESANLLLQLLKPSSFSPILAMTGMILLMFSRQERKKDVGNILIGFAILMFGMETMSGAVEPLADVPAFTNILLMFSNPVLGVLAGAVLTAIIQSSSASVGILQALCMTGSVRYGTAIPIIMGQNIGTCITAILSSLGANRNAKRAASIHLMFNLIGTTIFLTVFYTIHLFHPFVFLTESASPVGIAMIHTAFNVSATIVLLPFNRMFEKLAFLVIRETEEERQEKTRELDILDQRFLEVPGYALWQGREAVELMFRETERSLQIASGLIDDYSAELVTRIRQSENRVDSYEDQICNYLLALSRNHLSQEESQILSVLLHAVTDIETISDQICNIALVYKNLDERSLAFSEKARAELQAQQAESEALVDAVLQMFEGNSLQKVHDQADASLLLANEIRERHIERLKTKECTIELGLLLTDILTHYERIISKCVKTAHLLAQMGGKALEIHSAPAEKDR